MKQITSIGEILFDLYGGEKRIGGAPFNFIYHIINLTGNGNFISRIGNDRLGKDILEFLKFHNISSYYIQIDIKHPTGEASAKLDESKIPEWTIMPDTAYDFIQLSQEVKELIDNYTSCVYYGTLAQRSNESRNTIQSLFNSEVKYFCDLNIRQNFYKKEIIERSLKAANVVKLNYDELKLIADLLFNHVKDPFKLEDEDFARLIIKKFNIDLLCVTMGENGAILYKGNDSYHCKVNVKPDEIIDTVGAGDAYSVILCIGYLKNWNIKKINILACDFASEIIKIKGALPSDNSLYNEFRKKINTA